MSQRQPNSGALIRPSAKAHPSLQALLGLPSRKPTQHTHTLIQALGEAHSHYKFVTQLMTRAMDAR